jgi:hypothetical protein
MTSPMRRPLLTSHRAEIQRVERVSAQDTWVMGRVLVEGVGEARVDLDFPVKFGEEPLPLLGSGVLDSSDSVQSYSFPTANAVVTNWSTDGPYYTGASLAITTTGRVGQRLFMTFAFVGVALSAHAEGE